MKLEEEQEQLLQDIDDVVPDLNSTQIGKEVDEDINDNQF